MTKSLTFSNALVENPDVIFCNFVGNFIPSEWRNLTNNLMSPMVGRIESELLNPLIMAIYPTKWHQ